MNIRIAIADDHPLIAEGISKMLARYPHIEIGSLYHRGDTLLKGLDTQQPDVLLLDIQFPDTSGHNLVRTIVPLYPSMRILAISSIEDPFDIQDMLQQGCLGYVQKTVSSTVLAQAIETVYRGERFLEENIKERLWETMFQPKTAAPITLTEKELEILELVCNGLSNIEIGDKLFMSHRTVEKYKLGFYQKFGVQNAISLAKLAAKYKFIK